MLRAKSGWGTIISNFYRLPHLRTLPCTIQTTYAQFCIIPSMNQEWPSSLQCYSNLFLTILMFFVSLFRRHQNPAFCSLILFPNLYSHLHLPTEIVSSFKWLTSEIQILLQLWIASIQNMNQILWWEYLYRLSLLVIKLWITLFLIMTKMHAASLPPFKITFRLTESELDKEKFYRPSCQISLWYERKPCFW